MSDATNEVELSTQELAGLSDSKSTVGSSPNATPVAQSQSPRARSQPKIPSPARSSTLARYCLASAAMICIGVGIVAATQREDSPGARSVPRWDPLPDLSRQIIDEDEEDAIVDTRPPVRIRNEFDRSEVFEFPPGTSRQEARDQVARILLERAAARQSKSPPSRDGAESLK